MTSDLTGCSPSPPVDDLGVCFWLSYEPRSALAAATHAAASLAAASASAPPRTIYACDRCPEEDCADQHPGPPAPDHDLEPMVEYVRDGVYFSLLCRLY